MTSTFSQMNTPVVICIAIYAVRNNAGCAAGAASGVECSRIEQASTRGLLSCIPASVWAIGR